MENKKVDLSKRIFALFIDLVLFFVLMFVSSTFVINPIISSTADYQTQYQVYEDKLIASGLVLLDDNGTLQVAFYEFDENQLETYDQTLIDFYTNHYVSEEESLKQIESYQNSKKKYPDIFVYDEETKTYTITRKGSAQNFFVYAFNEALNYYAEIDSAYSNSYNAMVFYANVSKYSSILFSALIPFLILPLCLKGRSLGKLLFKLDVRKDNEELSTTKVGNNLLRSLILIVEIIASYIAYAIPALISLIMIMATKKGLSLHDYVAKTIVVDTNIKDENPSDDVIEGEFIEKESE